jgi:hypothetical protein
MWFAQFIGPSVLAGSLLLAGKHAVAADSNKPEPSAQISSYALNPVYRLTSTNGARRFTTAEAGLATLPQDGVAFLAVCTNEWLTGLVPLFAVERTNRTELRRRPPQGLESSSEPLFFALPPDEEIEALKIAGRWDCQATRASGDKSFLIWQLTTEGSQIAGRFDPETEYRVASVTGGTFRSNQIELRVDYFNDVYLLTGAWRDNTLRGKWRHIDNSERGTWEAKREARRFSHPGPTVRLYEWRRIADGARRYEVEGEKLDASWHRAAQPLCRVWPAAPRR